MSDPAPGPPTTAVRARWTAIDPLVAYAVLRLRCDVFVVEQACPYPELDGRDVEPATEHLWLAETGSPTTVLAYLRVLDDPAGRRIGRVVTATAARGQGLAALLVASVVTADGRSSDLVLDAQSHLEHWYARFGFAPAGAEFLEDGIPHVPMRRPAG